MTFGTVAVCLFILLTGLCVVRCHVPISGQTVLGMAAATGELHLYVLSKNEVKRFRVHDFFPVGLEKVFF